MPTWSWPLPARSGAWVVPTLLGAWGHYGDGYEGVAYMKDALGFVHLRGLAHSGAVPSTIFNLPAGYRPPGNQAFATVANNALARISVFSVDGGVYVDFGSNAWVSLNGITFKAV